MWNWQMTRQNYWVKKFLDEDLDLLDKATKLLDKDLKLLDEDLKLLDEDIKSDIESTALL